MSFIRFIRGVLNTRPHLARTGGRHSCRRRIGIEAGELLESRAMLSAGSLDPSFANGGKTSAAFDLGGSLPDWAQAMTLDSSGRVVVVGRARHTNGNDDFAIARFRSDGRLDTTFSSDGKVTVGFDLGGGNKDEAYSVAIDSKGRIIVAGYAQTAGRGDYDFAVVRLLPDGRLDTSFDFDGKTTIPNFDLFATSDDRASDVVIDKQGRIILVGQVSTDGKKDFGLARLTTAGALDSSFGIAGMQWVDFRTAGDDWAAAVALDARGRIVVAGTVSYSSGDHDFAVARLLPTGWLDTSFDFDGKQTILFDLGGKRIDAAADVVIDRQGKIVIAGTVDRSNAGDRDMGVVRLLPDGALDESFDSDGKVLIAFDYGGNLEDRATGVRIDAKGRIVVSGTATRDGTGNTDLAVARLTANGATDFKFGGGTGKATVAFDYGGTAPFRYAELSASKVVVDKKGRIIVAGTAKHSADADWDFVVARFRG